MKIEKVHLIAAVSFALTLSAVPAPAQTSGGTSPSAQSDSAKPFLGRWDLTLKAPDREYPSWIEIEQQNGKLSAQFVGRWGNARTLPKIEIDGAHITFVSPKEEEGLKQDMAFEGTLTGKTLSGTITGLGSTPWTWTGVRAPALDRNPSPQWGKPIQLFNGEGPDRLEDEPARSAQLDGSGRKSGQPRQRPRAYQRPSMCRTSSCTLNSTAGKIPTVACISAAAMKCRSRRNRKPSRPAITPAASTDSLPPRRNSRARPDAWQTFDITLIGRRVTVVQNGQTIIDNQEIPGITGGALNSHEALAGPIYLQGGEKGHVAFRNIVLTPAE